MEGLISTVSLLHNRHFVVCLHSADKIITLFILTNLFDFPTLHPKVVVSYKRVKNILIRRTETRYGFNIRIILVTLKKNWLIGAKYVSVLLNDVEKKSLPRLNSRVLLGKRSETEVTKVCCYKLVVFFSGSVRVKITKGTFSSLFLHLKF